MPATAAWTAWHQEAKSQVSGHLGFRGFFEFGAPEALPRRRSKPAGTRVDLEVLAATESRRAKKDRGWPTKPRTNTLQLQLSHGLPRNQTIEIIPN